MAKTTPSAFFAMFMNGKLLLEWDKARECWGLAQRMVVEIPPTESYVEMSFNNVLTRLMVREVITVDVDESVETRQVFSDSSLFICIIGGTATTKNPSTNDFWNLNSLPENVTPETRAALSIHAVTDRFV